MNKVILCGRLGADPELRKTPNDISVASFSIAVNRTKRKDGTQETDWIDCVAWRNDADFICKYWKKGKPILLTGNLQTRNYKDKNGNSRKSMEVIIETVEFCDFGNKNQVTSLEKPTDENDSSYSGNHDEFEDIALPN